MRTLILLMALLLTACTDSITQHVETLDTVQHLATLTLPPPPVQVAESGSTFFGKFATNAALNARRSFIADYHGEMRLTLFPNQKIECRWWVEGRITDPTVHDGPNGFVKAFSTLCVGKLQRDGSFVFRGAFLSEGPVHGSGALLIEETDETFTLAGQATVESIYGELILDGLFARSPQLQEIGLKPDDGSGIRFEAIATK